MHKKNHKFQKYQQLDKFTFSELVKNFVDFQRNSSILKQKQQQQQKIAHLKTLD